jgi:RHS repeat-associated protein
VSGGVYVQRFSRLMKHVSAGVAVSGSALLMVAGSLQPAWAAPAAAAAKAAVAAVPAPVTSADSVLVAAADARRQKSAVEVLPDRTDYSQTFANPDGTLTYKASLAPERVRQGSSWVQPDASLVQAADGSWSPAAAAAGLTLSGGGGTRLATLTSGGDALSVSWPTALPVPTVSGATATYAGVFPGVDLAVTAATDGGFDETLVIENQKAADDSQLADLNLGVSVSGGLSQHAAADGSVTMETAGGTPVFTSPPPLAWDSSSAGAGLRGPGSNGAAQAATAAYGRGSVRLGVPKGLLSGPASSFPVYVDPTYSTSSTELTHGLATSSDPHGMWWSSPPPLGVGYGPTYLIQRSYYRMSVPSALYGATILSATFSDQLTGAGVAASTSHTVTLHSTGAISSATTWDTQPTWNTSPAPVPLTFTTTSTTPTTTENWNVAPFVQAAATASAANWTLVLTNSSETNASDWVAFSTAPTISITYDFPPQTPSAWSMSPESWAYNGDIFTSAAKPSFSATATSPVGANVSYQFEILSGSTIVGSGTSASVTSGTQATWADTTALTDDATYKYQVRAYDGTAYGPWSAAQAFTVETDTPGPVTVSCSGYPANTWSAQAAGGTTCSFSTSLPYIFGYEWELGGVWQWSETPSVTIDPGPGEYSLEVFAVSDAYLQGPQSSYDFAVGAGGAMMSPVTGSQTSTTVTLQAGAPTGYTSAEFYYREGTTGTFQPVGAGQLTDETCNCSVTWPAATTADPDGVETDQLSWPVTQTVTDDGPVQVEAVFTNASGGTETTEPVTVTLDRVGTGADYGTTTAGPVTVGLQSGNAALSASDVSIASYGTDLTVGRTFNSVEPAVPSIFGPGWSTSLTGGVTTGWTQLSVTGTYVALQSSDGTSDTFTEGSTSGSTVNWTPQGDAVTAGLTLTQNTSNSTFTLADSSGTVTVFGQDASALVQNDTATVYLPQTVTPTGTGTGATGSTGIDYDGNSSDASYGDPVLIVAPDAASTEAPTTACPYPASASTWTAGCRGLQFAYNSSGDVTQINFVYSDNSGNFNSVAVADYGYDASGRLTSEWDPRLSTPLVTGYTYDETPEDADYGRITQVIPAQAAGSGAIAPWTLTYDTTTGSAGYGNLLSVSRTHSATYGGATATTTINYSVPLTTAAGGPINMDPSTVGSWAQTDPPSSAVAVFPPSHMPSSPPTASDWQYAQIDYYDANGKEVNTASYTGGVWAVTTTQYDAYGNTTWTLSAADRAAALASGFPAGAATTLASVNVYGCDDFGTIDPSCDNDDQQYEVLTDSYGPAHAADVDGTDETIRTHTAYTYDAGAPNGDVDATGDPYMLRTSQQVSASVGNSIPGSATADARTTTYTYGTTAASWALGEPLTTVTDPSGLDIIDTAVYNMSSSLYGGANLQTDSDMPSDTGGGGAGDAQTVYFTAGTNPLVAACGNKPEWANLTCQTSPVAQPGTTGLPDLPVTTYTYDDYLNVLTKTEIFGTTGTRTTTTGYDADQRPLTQTITVTGTGMGSAVPETQTVYSASTGLPTDTQTLSSTGTVTADINTTYDDFGQALTYTDASGNTTTYNYDIAGQMTNRADGKGTDSVAYDTAGDPTQITDSQAGTLAATYNPDGNLATETYPGGITATYTYDPTGTATSVSYDGASWSAPVIDAIVPNAQGDWATEAITDTAAPLTSTKTYIYDNDDRLTNVQDTLDGQCATRAHTYDADSNRTSLTSYAPGSEGACQNSTGTTTTEAYDSADRATNSGYAYDTQGDITSTPSADGGGSGNLSATYYANDMLAAQTQNGATETWALDPTLGRFATYTQNGVSYTNHYGDTSNNPLWASGNDGSWTRNVTDFNGYLAAEVTASGVTLELPDLHGDIMATATTSPTATGPATICVYTEFGTAETGTPGTYGWLGADQISSDALGGQLLMGARSYNSNTGRFSQSDPMPGGSANAYDYALQNPLTNSDLTGDTVHQYCLNITRFFRTCAAVFDHYSSMVYILWCEAQADWYQSLADAFSSLPWEWAQSLSYYYQARSLEYSFNANFARVVLSACGGEEDPNAGLLSVTAEARAGWWAFGWHYTGWWTVRVLPLGCHD